MAQGASTCSAPGETTQSAGGGIHVARRPGPDAPFAAPEPVAGVNTGFDDRDPWLSPDGQTLYSASDRSGEFEIYTAQRAR